jgi:N-acyl-D-amino-acid deacylase
MSVQNYDLIIKNGTIVDGVLTPEYVSDIAIKDGRIVKIASGLAGATRVIDARGLTVTPGFFDSHSHSDTMILTYSDQKEKVEQGITTVIGGMCGGSVAPGRTFPRKRLPTLASTSWLILLRIKDWNSVTTRRRKHSI